VSRDSTKANPPRRTPMATDGEQQQQAPPAEEVVSVEMPAPEGWTKKVGGGIGS